MRRGIRGASVVAIAGAIAFAPVTTKAKKPPALQRAVSKWSDGGATYRVEGIRYSRAKSRILSAASVSYLPPCGGSACIGSALVKRVPLRNLTIDASLTTAELSFGLEGERYSFEWSGEGQHETDTSGDRAEVERDGSVTGEVGGTTVVEPSEADAFLEESTTSDEQDVMPTPLPLPRGRGERLWFGAGSCWTSNAAEKKFTKLMSAARKKKGFGGLVLDPEVSKAARTHSQEMIDKDLLHHTPPSKLASRITKWTKLGENVGVGDGIDALHKAFMDSKVHRDNIMRKAFRYVGVGVLSSGGDMWVTVIFEAKKNPGTSMSMPAC